MNLASALLWGFVATVVLTTMLSASEGLGFSRMSIAHMLERSADAIENSNDEQATEIYLAVLNEVQMLFHASGVSASRLRKPVSMSVAISVPAVMDENIAPWMKVTVIAKSR